jgi:protein-L-isoaspartate(D-aspartate) O-methyltransferase
LTLDTQSAPEGKVFVTFRNQDPGRAAIALQALAVDGTKVSSIQISLSVKGRDMRYGPTPLERPSLIVQFYDSNREHLPPVVVGPWQDTFDWRRVSKLIHVPPRAREAIVRIGLNGATGVMSVDDVRLEATPK